MSLKLQQAFLSQLYTDASLMQRCLENPAVVAAEYQLEADWVKEICIGQEKRLSSFRNSLIHKRWKQAQEIFPRSGALEADWLKEHFYAFAKGHALSNPKQYNQDAFDFLSWLQAMDRPALLVLMRFEWEWGEQIRKGKRFRLARYAYPVWMNDFTLDTPAKSRWIFFMRQSLRILPF